MGFIVICVVIAIAMWLSLCVRCAVTHPFKTVYYGIRDGFKYLKYKRWNELTTGELICYMALFGRGKTLSVVHYIVARYNRYNGKKIYDPYRKKWVTQVVKVISNVDLNIPYEKFVSLAQVVSAAEKNRVLDEENDTLTVTLVLGDEFSVQMNSRNFKSNIDPLFLNTLLTCRHHHISIIYDAQRFGHVDALLRQVTSYCVECKKVWRFMCQYKYDAWDLENASSPSLVNPIARFVWFVRDKDFNAYDTLACVDNLAKSCKDGDMLSEEEIIALQCNNPVNMEGVTNYSKKYRKSRKKLR